MNKKIIISVSGFIMIVIIGMFLLNKSEKTPTVEDMNLDEFAKCITDSGAKFYGAVWCPHCQNQKNEFGSSVEFIPYIECATEDRGRQAKECQDAEIESYPTWDFPDGKRVLGEIDFKTIAEHTGCSAPEEK